MARSVIAGIGAIGAAIAALAGGVYVMNPAEKPAAEAVLRAAPRTVCIRSNVRLVEGMTRECLAPAGFEALRDRAVIGADAAPVEIALTGPDGETALARSCADYDRMIEGGWYALTGADMRREEYFKRACGALAMLASAEPAATSHFANGAADAADIRSMATAEATGFGETAPSTAVDVSEVDDGVWRLVIGEGETMVYEIAHADFTGDGLGEILAYVSVGAAGGTARTGSLGFLEKSAAGGSCAFAPR